MSNRFRWLAMVAVLVTGSAGAADVTPGFGVSFRVGYGTPLGSPDPEARLGDALTGQLPFQVDLGYRVTPELALAAYGQYAFALAAAATGCSQQGVTCSGRDLRAGVELLWRFLPGHALDPWVAAGVGWEWATVRQEGGGEPVELTLRGFELANAQLGGDCALSPGISVGPFVQLAVATWSTSSVSGGGSPRTAAIGAGLHAWLQLGIRGSFGL